MGAQIWKLWGQLQDWVTNSKFWSTKLAITGSLGGVLTDAFLKVPDTQVNLKVGLGLSMAVLGGLFCIAQAYEKVKGVK